MSDRPAPLLRPVLGFCIGLLACMGHIPALAASGADPCQGSPYVVILLYHRFSVDVPGETTVRLDNLRAQIAFLLHRGYTFRPLRDVVRWRMDSSPGLPCRTAVLTVDDDNRSTYELLLPVIRATRIPVTLFIYPSAISNASYALTWDELRDVRSTGLFDVQSHTVWHPNFKIERKRLSPEAFRSFAATQLAHSKAELEERLGGSVDLIAWPFGIHDEELERMAAEQGYEAGFGIDARLLDGDAPLFALPRVTMPDTGDAAGLDRLMSRLEGTTARKEPP